ncbi:hypothetical protein FACS189496_3160 [Bacilli bacterium]|nr:hypothetical protein FACS189496_3160 [Bacilli bacterium]
MQTVAIIDQNENEFISENTIGLFESVRIRLNSLLGHANDVYELSDKLAQSFDAKTNTHLNKAMTLMAAVNVITVIWVIFGAVYGMNFKAKEMQY